MLTKASYPDMQFTFFNQTDSCFNTFGRLRFKPKSESKQEDKKGKKKTKNNSQTGKNDDSHLFLHSFSLIGVQCHVIVHENNALKRDSSTLINPP